jgi:protein-disulfide isomerase
MNIFKIMGVGLFALALTSCQSQADKYIENYLETNGQEFVEKALQKIIEKRMEEQNQARQGPTLEQRLAKRVDVPLDGAPVKGPADAAITIVEFSDFECPFCKRVLPTLDQIQKEYEGKVRFAFRHNPLPFHEAAVPVHLAAMAAQEQGKFWEFHAKAFENQREFTDANIVKWAQELGLNIEKFNADRAKPAFKERMENEIKFARDNGAQGTPAFFVNGVLLVGAQPFEEFKSVIDALLAEKS